MHRVVVAGLLVIAACGDNRAPDRDPADLPDGPGPARRGPAVVILIGDGMGRGQLETASLYRHGATGRLYLEQLPVVGELRTGAPSGITDSAAAATVMATGVYAYNGAIGVDRHGQPVETLLETAAARGWATGVVTTTSLPHATPAGFSAHVGTRADYAAIAEQQVRVTRPTVMLGGGTLFYAGLDQAIADAGYTRVRDRTSLAAAVDGGATRLFGSFADDHLTFVTQRAEGTGEPTLPELAMAALTVLDRDPDGFAVMIEGGRIDHAGHGNDLVNSVHETLAFDDTVRAVSAWARARGDVTVLVTADHECGGLEVVTPQPAGTYPDVRWRWGAHTNARVIVAGEGPGSEALAGVVDHRWIHAIGRARITGRPFVAPGREPVPDGELGDLRHRAAVQTNPSGYGAGFNQLDALWLDATADGLYLGLEGVFEWDQNAVEVWIDVDPGAGTGVAAPSDLADRTGLADGVLAAGSFTLPEGMGADLALVAVGGADPHLEDLIDSAGLRGVSPPYGVTSDLAWRRAAINYGDVRARTAAHPARPAQGLEAMLPWAELYPAGLPAGATVAVTAVLVNSDGGHTSNQALPPFPAGTDNPGRRRIALPGAAVYRVDADGDGAVDGHRAPVVVPVVTAP